MKVFVTGSTGFIGKNFVKAILKEEGIETISLVRNSTGSKGEIVGDMNDLSSIKSQLETEKPDVLLHMAWQGIPDLGQENSKLNLKNSIALFDMAVELGVKKIVVTGSCFEYDDKTGTCLEEDATGTTDYFPWAKTSLHNYLRLIAKEHDIEYNWLRVFYVYGPGQRSGSLLPFLVSNYTKGEVPGVRTPENANDFVYVGDVVNGIIGLIKNNAASGAYNICSGEAAKVKDICAIMADCFDIENGEWAKQEDILSFKGDYTKLNEAIQWTPATSMEEGVKKYVEWYKNEVK